MSSPARSPRKFKPLSVAKSSNVPLLGRTRLMAHLQKAAVQLAPTSTYPKLSAFLPQNVAPWIANYFKAAFHGKFKPYPTYAADGVSGVYALRAKDGGATIKISIAGDWGTGTDEAALVAAHIRDFKPDYTIHLGDVYYVGDDREVKENFLGTQADQYAPVSFPQGTVGTFAMLGNHEMYGGGGPYFREIFPYCETGAGAKQSASFFCLEAPAWRIIGLDTGYNSVGTPILGSIPIIKKIPFFDANCKLQNELLAWLAGNVNPQKNKKPTLLLSHHQYFSAYPDEAFALPAKQLKDFFAGQEVVWIWGHEHRLTIYDKFSPDGNIVCYGRCLGHGGMPVETGKPGGKPPVAFFDPRSDYPVGDGTTAGWNGFLNMTLDGAAMTLDYRDLRNTQLFAESFAGSPDGSLQYSYQKPVPVLRPPQ